jgi:hypothetical protein
LVVRAAGAEAAVVVGVAVALTAVAAQRMIHAVRVARQ